MQESVFLVTYVDKCRIEARDYFPDSAKVDVSDGKLMLGFVEMIFGQPLILHKSYPVTLLGVANE
jgi:hypothetical protein